MGSNINTRALVTLFLSLSLFFFAIVTATQTNTVPNLSNPNYTTPKISTPSSVPTSTPSSSMGKCPMDALKLGVCANVNLVDVVVGSSPTLPCCSLIQGLVDLEAALCLCTAIRANILGINLNVPVALSLVLNNCGKKAPTGFECF